MVAPKTKREPPTAKTETRREPRKPWRQGALGTAASASDGQCTSPVRLFEPCTACQKTGCAECGQIGMVRRRLSAMEVRRSVLDGAMHPEDFAALAGVRLAPKVSS